MPSLPSQIMSHAVESPGGTLLCPSALLHLGNRAAVDQALSRLARKGELMRVCQGVYVRPIRTRFRSSSALPSPKCSHPCPHSGVRRLYLVEGWQQTLSDLLRRFRYGRFT